GRRGGAADLDAEDGGVAVAQDRARDVGAVAVGVVRLVGPAERVQLGHAAGEGGVDVRGRALVEPRVGDAHHLAGAVERQRAGVRGVDAQDLAGDVVVQLVREHFLDVPDGVDGGHGGETVGPDGQPHLVARRLDVGGIEPGRLGDLLGGVGDV